eukprot:scaffold13729_cov100-Cyclotella_meneghiniana.AAC.1
MSSESAGGAKSAPQAAIADRSRSSNDDGAGGDAASAASSSTGELFSDAEYVESPVADSGGANGDKSLESEPRYWSRSVDQSKFPNRLPEHPLFPGWQIRFPALLEFLPKSGGLNLPSSKKDEAKKAEGGAKEEAVEPEEAGSPAKRPRK